MTVKYPDPKHRPVWRPRQSGGDLDVQIPGDFDDYVEIDPIEFDLPEDEYGMGVWTCTCGLYASDRLVRVEQHIEQRAGQED